LMPPAWLMRSAASCVPTSAVVPPAAAAPVSGCRTPILKGLAWPKASRQGAGTSMPPPIAPAAAAERPRNLRRVVLPRHQMSLAQGSSCQRSAIADLLRDARRAGIGYGEKGADFLHRTGQTMQAFPQRRPAASTARRI